MINNEDIETLNENWLYIHYKGYSEKQSRKILFKIQSYIPTS